MTPAHTLIRGGLLVGPDHDDAAPRRADLLITDGTIAAAGPDLTAPDGATVLDASRMLVLPGLIDTHRHTWQTVLRHRFAGWSLSDYIQGFGRVGREITPDEVYAGVLLGALSALDAGITTMVDWSHIQNSPAFADATVRALRDAGIRAVFAHSFGFGVGARPAEGHPADIRRVRAELLPDDDALVTLAMGARGPDFAEREVTVADFALARELGIPITVHTSTGRAGANASGVRTLHEAKLLGPDVTVVHANGTDDEALRMLADHDTQVSVAPQIELTMPELGNGTAVRRMRAAGLRPSLSTDSEVGANGDLFTQMRFALAADRAETPDGGPLLDTGEVLRMATAHGARATGLADRTGALAPGLAADVILLRADDLNLAPLGAPAAATVLAAHPGNVDTVLVGGRILKRDGRLVADAGKARADAAAAAERLMRVV